jgi:hypothetical protein
MSFIIVVIMDIVMETHPTTHNMPHGTKELTKNIFGLITWYHVIVKVESNTIKPPSLGNLS